MKDKKEIKIAHVVCTFPPYRGGLGNVAYHLADYLSRLGLNVTVFTPKRGLTDDIKSFFKIHKLVPQFTYGNAAVVLQLGWRLRKFDIVHLHYPFLGASFAVLLVKLIKRGKLKLILHYHMDLVGQGWQKWVFKLYKFIFIKCLISAADEVIATSKDYLQKSFIYPYYLKYQSKFNLLPNGVDLEYFRPLPKDSSLVTKYNLQNKQVILFVGGLDNAHYFKGVNYLIKAFEILNRADTVLFIVGDGNLRDVYEEMAEAYGLRNRVIFTGYVPDVDLLKYYNLCDIFVLPSIDKSEAFGMVLIEAMACAKPVIASDLAGVREVVISKVDGRLVKPKDVEGLAEQMKILLDQKNVREEYGQKGRAKVEELYSWPKITQDLLKIYKI